MMEDGGDASFGGSTTGTPTTTTDYDTITAVSTTTSRGGITASSATKNAVPKTPLCNYSSRPSFLTARILRDDDLLPMSIVSESSTTAAAAAAGVKGGGDGASSVAEEPFLLDHKTSQVEAVRRRGNDENHQSDESCLKMTNDTSKRPNVEHVNFHKDIITKENESDTRHDASMMPPHENLECHQALEILRQTAAELGIANYELASVLPTVQKLVRVITQHVPRLEKFVEQVCETVMECDDDDDDDDDDNDSNNNKKNKNGNGTTLLVRRNKDHHRRNKKRRRKNMETRKERMDVALKVLKNGWQNDSYNRTTTSAKEEQLEQAKENIVGLHRLDVNGGHIVVENENLGHDDTLLPYVDYQSYGAFTMQVKGHLAKHQRNSCLLPTCDCLSAISNHHDDGGNSHGHLLLTDAEALEEIKRLIEFEEKYSHKVNNLMLGEDATSSQSSSDGSSQSQTDTVLQDLLRTDTTTLRRFILHFAYLFSVRQDDILGKMNDLYVFSHEATSLIQNIKRCLNLPVNCSIHTVARQVISRIENTPQSG
eukprot:CAMPEP_0176484404 /NCGR_PEP_ID=MMETSP0200_2-20121128/4435_1 /TAXON_ID=947934 /ORGANISM="Chaetoceros sp., Strain GSL56" /LENGTH=539 /DNA_ID=CAMNT_0017880873 /DNA_START=218 /DNA_END=1837 /DNA_ORIENTATION=+